MLDFLLQFPYLLPPHPFFLSLPLSHSLFGFLLCRPLLCNSLIFHCLLISLPLYSLLYSLSHLIRVMIVYYNRWWMVPYVLVESLSLIQIRQHFICLLNKQEPHGIGRPIWVVLQGKRTVGGFDIIEGCRGGQFKKLIVVFSCKRKGSQRKGSAIKLIEVCWFLQMCWRVILVPSQQECHLLISFRLYGVHI
ncbi:hypothetical protein FGO68_gene10873 [Halteria grandinella]|uniref:Uncharacterized protein n=1 Tax=Halteria grandinella TaxID=5974 RepID=A0A8J8NSZ7_HALGN|nr:hypothetical protein FGO68_gene10873 [Halteria grandinella]